ncbi:nuA3 HAT complex component nto1 [Serendipita sp. 400]|nr:nuA3 HAT complex component nto1 [Serendipita sp. 400]
MTMRAHPPESLPKPSFRKIDDDLSRRSTSHFDALAKSFGYRGGDKFIRPGHYIRYTEPLESDLMRHVEYDMDEQDLDWLQALNAERRKEQHGPVSQEIFEVIMDQLEKEWFTLMKRVPKPDMDLPAEDSCCAVCDDGEGENSNAIVFCDGCNLAVHQDCYGVPYIPEGQWLCRKCTVSPEVPVSCLLCPNEGGAFKQTSSGKWAHLLCAIWIPEVTVQNHVFMEPIEHIENVSKSRWKLRCTLCKDIKGACIQCDIKSCYSAFHATCARKQKFLCSMKTLPGQEEQPLRAFCERHLPPDMQETRNAYLTDIEDRAEEIQRIRQSNKAARAYARTYKTGIPLVPQYIVTKVMTYISKVTLRKKPHVVLSVCKYWSLKREARRGAPLLKRLHLEPWTTATSAAQQTEEDRLRKLEYLKRLRHRLFKLRELAELVQHRETDKTDQLKSAVQELGGLLFPHEEALRGKIKIITGWDPANHFHSLVSDQDMPEYYEKIKSPKCWLFIKEKLDGHGYWDPEDFKNDMKLVWDNALSYYEPQHELYKLASKLKQKGEPLLEDIPPMTDPEREYAAAAYEPVVQDIQMLVDGMESKQEASNLLDKLLKSVNEPNQPLLDAILPPKFTVNDTTTQDGEGISPPEINVSNGVASLATDIDASQKGGPEPISPQRPPRIRDRKAERERRLARLALQAEIAAQQSPNAPVSTRSGRKVIPVIPNSPIKTSPTRKSTSVPFNVAVPLEDVAMREVPTDAVSVASSSRKRKREEYEVPANDLEMEISREVESFERLKNDPVLTNEIHREATPTGPVKGAIPSSSHDIQDTLTEVQAIEDDKEEPAADPGSPPKTPKPPKMTKEQMNEIKRLKERERKARKKAEAAAAKAHREAQRALQAEKAQAEKEARMTEAVFDDGSSSSSLTDIDEDDKGGKEEEEEVPIRRATRRTTQHSKEEDPPQKTQGEVQKKKTGSLSTSREGTQHAGMNELLVVQVGPAKKNRSERPKKEEILGDPPVIGENGMEGGTLVWAKQEGHPWFPAVIYEVDDDQIPAKIHQTKDWFCENANLTEEERANVQIVQFMDRTGTWAWLAPKSIRLLFESAERDKFLLNARFRNTTLKNEVRAAYARAEGERELDDKLEDEREAMEGVQEGDSTHGSQHSQEQQSMTDIQTPSNAET